MFTKDFDGYVCDGDTIKCEVDGFDCVATVYHDEQQDRPDEHSDGFWPSREPGAAGWVRPEDFEAEQAKAENAMRAWENDEWFYGGVDVTVSKRGIQLTKKYHNALWGIECNYPGSANEYLREVANDLLGEALEDAKTNLKELCAA